MGFLAAGGLRSDSPSLAAKWARGALLDSLVCLALFVLMITGVALLGRTGHAWSDADRMVVVGALTVSCFVGALRAGVGLERASTPAARSSRGIVAGVCLFAIHCLLFIYGLLAGLTLVSGGRLS
jgi:hypothetical protein